MLTALAVTIIILLTFVLAWHLFFPLLGGVIAITATAWGFVVASVIILCVAILLLFILTGAGIFIVGIFALIWTLVAIILFPVLFPVLAPLFIILVFISYFRSRQKGKNKEQL